MRGRLHADHRLDRPPWTGLQVLDRDVGRAIDADEIQPHRALVVMVLPELVDGHGERHMGVTARSDQEVVRRGDAQSVAAGRLDLVDQDVA